MISFNFNTKSESSFPNVNIGQNTKSQSCQQWPVERMEKDSNRMVTYSKRHNGLLKKANELVTLCGVQALCVIFSPANKLVTFGHPSVEAIINRFMPADNTVPQDNREANETSQDESQSRSNMEVSLLNDQIDREKKCAKEILNERKLKSEEAQRFLEPPDTFSYPELKQIQAILIALKNNIRTHAHNLEAQSNLSRNPSPGPSVIDGQNTRGQVSLINPTNMAVGQNYYPNPTLIQSQTIPPFEPTNHIPGSFNNQNTMLTYMGWNTMTGQTFLMGKGSSSSPALPFNAQSRYMGSNPIPGDRQIFTNFMGQGNLNSSAPPFNPQGRHMGSNPIPGNYQTFQNLFMADRNLNYSVRPSNPQGGYMGINPIPGDYQTFRNLMGEGSSNPPNPPFNPQGGFGFGPEDPGMN